MKKNLLKRKIPTLIALVVLFIGAAAGVLLVGRDTNFLPRAGPEHTPKQIQITNLTDKSFTVSWITDAPTSGFVRYGQSASSLNTTEIDDRDQVSGQSGNFTTHHTTVKALTPSSTYYFKLGSGPNQALYDNNGQPYTITTGPQLSANQNSDTAYGTVTTPAQTPAEGAIIYLKLPGAAPLSTLVKTSGTWAVPLSSIRTQDLTNYFTYDPSTQTINIEVVDSQGSKTIGTTNTSNDQPTPPIILGQNFDFTSTQTPAPTPSPTPKLVSSFDPDPITPATSSAVILTNPSRDGEQINTTRPEIQGKAPALTTLTITVESPVTYQEQIAVDSLGNFAWTPPADLDSGEHTVTIAYVDDLGQQQTLTRTFVVLAQGSSNLPSLTATPSGSTPTPSPTPKPSTAPSTSPTPTPSPTLRPTVTPNPISTPSTSTTSSIPVAGVAGPTSLLTLMGLALIISGLLLRYTKSI